MLVGVLLVVVVGVWRDMLSCMCHLSRHSDNVDGITNRDLVVVMVMMVMTVVVMVAEASTD
jgi:hypothetical protein